MFFTWPHFEDLSDHSGDGFSLPNTLLTEDWFTE